MSRPQSKLRRSVVEVVRSKSSLCIKNSGLLGNPLTSPLLQFSPSSTGTLLSNIWFLLGGSPLRQSVAEISSKFRQLSEEERETLKREHKNQQMELCFIEDPIRREKVSSKETLTQQKVRKEALNQLESAIRTLDYRCNDETILITVPREDAGNVVLFSRKSLLTVHECLLQRDVAKVMMQNCKVGMPYSGLGKRQLETIFKRRMHDLCLVCTRFSF